MNTLNSKNLCLQTNLNGKTLYDLQIDLLNKETGYYLDLFTSAEVYFDKKHTVKMKHVKKHMSLMVGKDDTIFKVKGVARENGWMKKYR